MTRMTRETDRQNRGPASAPSSMAPFRLAPFFSPRVWGREHLRPWYAETGTVERVGEAWLTGPSCVVQTGPDAGTRLEDLVALRGGELLGSSASSADLERPEFPLLIKLLFPEDKLSVQVHPDDREAHAMQMGRGKTECWYVLEAEPDSTVALGLRPGTTPEQVRSGVANGTLEQLLNQVPVSPGEMVFVDAGTVHAIGPGLVLLETQQMSDITFRMYDYGRPRELHLDQALAVMKTSTRAGKIAPRPMPGFTRLIDERYFTVDRFELDPAAPPVRLSQAQPCCLIPLMGSGRLLSGAVELPLLLAQAILVPAGCGVTLQAASRLTLLRCSAP